MDQNGLATAMAAVSVNAAKVVHVEVPSNSGVRNGRLGVTTDSTVADSEKTVDLADIAKPANAAHSEITTAAATLFPQKKSGLILRRGRGNGSNNGGNTNDDSNNYNTVPLFTAGHNKDTDCYIVQGRIVRLAGRKFSNMY